MPGVFVSYSRRDRVFVSRLGEALEGAGKSVWVDLDDLHPASVWSAELQRAIEETDAFVFVISPDSVGSSECAKELEHAASLNKRIILLLNQLFSEIGNDALDRFPSLRADHSHPAAG